MEKAEQIKFRKLLKKNGFIKSKSESNRKLMEFIKGDMFRDENPIFVYTYEECDVYFGSGHGYKFNSIKEFSEIYYRETGNEFIN